MKSEQGYTRYLFKEVAQVRIQLYDFMFLDTNNIEVFDFAKHITDYEVTSVYGEKFVKLGSP